MTSSEIVVRRMSDTDNDAMSKLLGDVFSRRDPPTVSTKFSLEKLEKIAELFGSKSAKEGLSSVALDEASGEIVGAVLAHSANLGMVGSATVYSPEAGPFEILAKFHLRIRGMIAYL
ncbi:hypothetical protein D1823_13540 [Ruegeria sp. AD91A]|uniref:hypothetical protein n=1 Tax=Ruegeria sp. AD91A TaxID=2293862 RepID=UPI000E469A05|nr:hypothetical protein [Ruegeria sp. AD91A]AXT27505.1 hypothetical protein D1823_13540 [Ruegeria sp. AD91A]